MLPAADAVFGGIRAVRVPRVAHPLSLRIAPILCDTFGFRHLGLFRLSKPSLQDSKLFCKQTFLKEIP